MEQREQEFLDYVQGGGLVETDDWMPDEYRARLIKFIEMHGNSELMGVLPERDWILRAPTLQRKLALTAKIQDEVGHCQLIYRVVEDLGKPRERCLDDLISGKSKFHNVFHYPTKSWGDVGVIAWLVDAAAIISQKALLKCSYAPYARVMKKVCWEESFHILHGRDTVLAMVTGTAEQRELVQEALDRWWEPLMHFHGTAIPAEEDPMVIWRIKSQGNEEARQQFLEGYVPQILELGLEIPDPEAAPQRRGRLGVHRARLGQAARASSPATGPRRGAARVPPALAGRDGLGLEGGSGGGSMTDERPPQLDPELVQSFVSKAHGDLDAVRDLLAREPELVNAAWDWGGGDWETGLGAAAHMGEREIALFLLERRRQARRLRGGDARVHRRRSRTCSPLVRRRARRKARTESRCSCTRRRAATTPATWSRCSNRGPTGAMIWEVFRQERKGQPFTHGGSFHAPDQAFADAYAREFYARRGESVALWVVPREAITAIEEFLDEFDLKYHRVDGYSLKARLKEARERGEGARGGRYGRGAEAGKLSSSSPTTS